MPISFSNIPSDIKIPLYYVEVDPSMAGLPVLGLPALLVGTMLDPMTSGATGTPDTPIAIGSQAQADAAFGQGSELSRMFMAYFASNFANQVFGLGVQASTGGAAASGAITITTPPTQAGTIALYIGGESVPVNVASSDTADEIASAIVDAVNAQEDLPVTAASTTGTVTLTCNWNGTTGNDISVSLNYYGSIGGEMTPPGLVMTLPTTGFLTGGTGTPDFANAISNLGEQIFEYVALPYTDSNSLMAWEDEYGFTDTGRWGWQRQLYGLSAKRDTMANLITWGNTRNSGITSVLAVEKESPSPIYEWTAAYTAKAQRALILDPARPLQTLALNTIKLAPLSFRFDVPDLQQLASNGLATQRAGSDNQPMISRETTTYQLNLYGNPDIAYELVTILATLARLIRNQKAAITTKFPRMKLADDGTRFGPGQAIVTPSIIKAELIAEYATDEFNGLVQDVATFTQNLLVERDANDPNRINVLYPPNLIGQLRVFALLTQFRLQSNEAIDAAASGSALGVTGVVPAGGIPT
jgi:phage tail sheath gpL-like